MSNSHNWQPRIATREQEARLQAVCLHFDSTQKSHGLIQAIRVLDELISRTADGDLFVYADEGGEQSSEPVLPAAYVEQGSEEILLPKLNRWTVKVSDVSDERARRIMEHYKCVKHVAYRTAYMTVGAMVERQDAGEHVWCIGRDGGYGLVVL